jgi:translation elongation factor EF-4
MKRNQVTLAVLLAALSFVAAPSASALSHSQVVAIKKVVADIPPAEMAAKAADLVTQASKNERKEVALVTVREIATKRPATIVPVVAAISKAAPEVSAAVAAEAAKFASEQASAIAKAAAAGAPAEADVIAAAVAKEVPAAATKVTRAVASLVPDQTSKIVETVVASVPAAQPEITADSTIRRMTQRSASEPTGTGIITTRPGTIRGTPPPNSPPTPETPILGFDYARP